MEYIQKKYSELDTFIPTLEPGTYNLEVDCAGEKDLGEFGVKLSNKKSGVFFNLKPINIDPSITNASYMFDSCSGLLSIDTSAFTHITNALAMFARCTGLTTIDTKAFAQVTNASYMFYECSRLTSIDTKAFTKVTNAYSMFQNCSGLTSIDTSAFTQVTDADNMFEGCSGLKSIDTKAFTQVTNARYMFNNCSGLTKINWGAIKPAENTDMFLEASAAKAITVDDYETKKWIETNAANMKLESYTLKANPDTIVIPESMHYIDLDFFIPIYKPGIYNLTVDCTGVEADQFRAELDTSPFGKKLQAAKKGVFFSLIPINIGPNVTNTSFMLKDCPGLISVDTSAFTQVTNAPGMFMRCKGLTSIDASAFARVTDAMQMFEGCTGLTSVNNPNFNSAISTSSMFYGCTSLKTISTSSFSQVATANYMFYGCIGLTFIDISPFTQATSVNGMLNNCTGLSSIKYGNKVPSSFDDMFTNVPDGLKISTSAYPAQEFLTTNKEALGLANPQFIELYEDLGTYIPTLPEGLTPVTVDCTNVNPDQYFAENMETSAFGKKFQLAGLAAKVKLNLVNIDESVTNINNMFLNCTSLQEIDTENFVNVVFVDRTFMNCTSLTTVINTRAFNNCASSESTFEGCSVLVTVTP